MIARPNDQSKSKRTKKRSADALSFVESRLDGKGGFDYWIKPQDGQDLQEQGRARADELTVFLAENPSTGNASLMADIAHSQIEKGQRGECERAFWQGISDRYIIIAAIEKHERLSDFIHCINLVEEANAMLLNSEAVTLAQKSHINRREAEKLWKELGEQGIDESDMIDKLDSEWRALCQKLDKIADDAINNSRLRTPETLAGLADYAQELISGWLSRKDDALDIEAASDDLGRIKSILSMIRETLAEKIQKH